MVPFSAIQDYATEGIAKGAHLDIGEEDLETIMKIVGLTAKALPEKQPQQQPGYQSMVPPQSIVISPPESAQAQTGPPKPRTSLPQQRVPQSLLSAAAANKLAQESDSDIGGTIGTLAGAGIGLALGGPKGALVGAGMGNKLLG